MNTFLFLAVAATFISYSVGFTTPLPEESIKTTEDVWFSIHNSTKNSNGDCVCHVSPPPTIQCTTLTGMETNIRINELQTEISALSTRVEQHVAFVDSQGAQITALTTTMMTTLEKLEQIEAGNLVISRPEYETLRREIADMEALLLVLKQNQTASSAVILALEAEIANITAVLEDLETTEALDTAQLLAEIEDLKKRLTDCQQNEDAVADLFETWNHAGTQDSCRKPTEVSAPYTIHWDGNSKGTWFRDPVKDQGKVYSFHTSSSSYLVDVFPTVSDYHNGQNAVQIRTVSAAYGTGMVAYNGSLYYPVTSKPNIARYDLSENKEFTAPLPGDTVISYTGDYLPKAYTVVDLAVDETGLWVIYSRTSSFGVIVISKIDPQTLVIIQTWTTTVSKASQANCFMMCKVLYCTNSYNTHSDKINYNFDTRTSQESFINVKIDSKFLYTNSLKYNPYDQKLYGWDNGHQVVYEISF